MNNLILTKEEIEQENIRMRLEDDSLILLSRYPQKITSTALLDKIKNDFIPDQPISKYILENRNLKKITEEIYVENAITITRSTLRYLPTEESFYRSTIVDNNIASVIPFATPLLILHHSLDDLWYYVETPYYRGWILKEEVTLISEQIRNLFENPPKFVTITMPLFPFLNTFLDMGTKFPLLGVHSSFYEVLIPTSQGLKICRLPKEICYVGYLPYTPKNILKYAQKFLNIPYRWGGIQDGVDCSFFIQSLFRIFGLSLPRDTQNLEKVFGIEKINLKGKTELEKKEILKKIPYPAILHKNGHILLALSDKLVIHAYGDAKKVILSLLDSCYGTNLYPLLTSISLLRSLHTNKETNSK